MSIGFDSASDYDNNFWISSPSEKDMIWSAGGSIVKDDRQGTAAYAIYNQSSSGGINGSGGTAGGTSLDKFVNFSIQVDYRVDSRDSAVGFGFYVKGSDDLSSGYMVLFRMSTASSGTGNIDVRIWGPDSSGTDTLGTSLMGSTAVARTSDTTWNAWHTLRLDVLDMDGQVKLVSSVWDTGTGQQVGQSIEFTHATAPLLGAGQVGFRMRTASSATMEIDNFVIQSIPEPSAGLLALVGAACVMGRRNLRRARGE